MSTKEAREETDDSLADERAKADAAVNEASAVEQQADKVIEHAREGADEILKAARVAADAKLQALRTTVQTQREVEHEREIEDRVIDLERAEADRALLKERAANARVLARLLPIERDKTDKYLLTERARSDEALANRDDFLGMVSHDLRDLLAGIALTAESIVSNIETATTSLSAAQRIQRSAGRMTRLIGDLVDIASIDAGKLAVHPTRVDAFEVLREALETWEPQAKSKHIRLELIEHGPVAVDLDHERIVQVIGNLIMNALKFSAGETKIVLSIEEQVGQVLFSVSDSGSGIATEKLEAIFERFWQVGKDRRGLGLGLYISKCLVEAHGGTIWAESEFGVGSRFSFAIPRTS